MSTLSITDIRAMLPEEINERWDEIAATLAAQPNAPLVEPWHDPDEARSLSIDEIKRMSTDQVLEHYDRVMASVEAAYRNQSNAKR